MSGYHKVAVIDGAGTNKSVGLYWADPDDNPVCEIPWPQGWPECVTPEFLRSRGYEVIFA